MSPEYEYECPKCGDVMTQWFGTIKAAEKAEMPMCVKCKVKRERKISVTNIEKDRLSNWRK